MENLEEISALALAHTGITEVIIPACCTSVHISALTGNDLTSVTFELGGTWERTSEYTGQVVATYNMDNPSANATLFKEISPTRGEWTWGDGYLTPVT